MKDKQKLIQIQIFNYVCDHSEIKLYDIKLNGNSSAYDVVLLKDNIEKAYGEVFKKLAGDDIGQVIGEKLANDPRLFEALESFGQPIPPLEIEKLFQI